MKAIWTKAFPKQAKALRPERRGQGVKAQSGSQKARSDVYRAIADAYRLAHPLCEACNNGPKVPQRWTDDIHHKRGRIGLLLFDVRYFMAVCRRCHDFIHQHPKEAKALGLLG